MDFEVFTLERIEEAINQLKNGGMVIVTDSESRENEGDLIALADTITPEQITFMAVYGRGLICAPISEELAEKLSLPPMVTNNTDHHQTAFTVSVDYIDTTTGISAYERAKTIQKLVDENTKSTDLRRPGHIFPLVAKEGGLLVREGHTEASIELAKLCGRNEAAVICEIMGDDGFMLSGKDLSDFAEKHHLLIISIEMLKAYLIKNKEIGGITR